MEDYKDIYEKIGNYVRKLTSNTEQIEEVIQEVFIKAYQSIGSLKDRDKLSSWLQRIAYTTIADHYRKQKKLNNYFEIDSLTIPSVLNEVNEGNEALMECIKAIVKLLPDEQKELLEAVEIRGMSQVQFAKEHGLPLSTVKSRFQRAKKKIRDKINKGCIMSNDKYGNVTDYSIPKITEEKMRLF